MGYTILTILKAIHFKGKDMSKANKKTFTFEISPKCICVDMKGATYSDKVRIITAILCDMTPQEIMDIGNCVKDSNLGKKLDKKGE